MGFEKVNKKYKSPMGFAYKQAMKSEITVKHGRRPEFRPSGLPLCPIHVFVKLQRGTHRGYFEQSMGADGGFFTSVGTAAHENIQRYIGNVAQVFGDWKCTNPNCKESHKARDLFDKDGNLVRKGKLTRKNTTNNLCPKCKHSMFYEEKEVSYGGLKGHIDCILKLPNGKFIIGDYKTTTKAALQGWSKELPCKQHLIQLPLYCWILEKKYGLKIEGFSLIYICRDNPFDFKEHFEVWDGTWRKRMAKRFKLEKLKYMKGVKAFKTQNVDIAIKHKPCSCIEEYKKEIDFYDECPFLSVCFNKYDLRSHLKKIQKKFPVRKKSVNETLKLIPARLVE